MCSVIRSYEESIKLANLGIRPTSVWGLLVLLFRCDICYLVHEIHLSPHRSATPLILALLQDIFALSIPVNAKPFAEDETDTRFTFWVSVRPVSAHVPVKGPHGLNGAQAPAKDNAVTCIAPSLPIASLVVDDLKDGVRMMHTVVHDGARRLSCRKPGYNDPEVRAQPGAVIVTVMRFLTLLTVPP